MVKFRGQKVKSSQILRFHYFDRIAGPQSQKRKPIQLKFGMKEYKQAQFCTPI